jgi:hypothetical protein
MLALVKNFLVEKKCGTVCCCDATASSFVSKVRGKVFTHFHTVAIKRHNSMQNWLFGLPGQIFSYEQSPCCQRKWWAFPWLCSSPVSPVSVSVNLNFLCMAHAFFPEHLSIHYQGLSHFSRDLHKIWSCSFVVSIAKSHDSKWKDLKNQKFRIFLHRLPRYASIIIYCCIVLLQLLYIFQHQSRKLRIPHHIIF